LESLLDEKTTKKKRLKSAEFLLKVFGKIARWTVANAYFPPPDIPSGVREIAKRL